MEVSGICTRCGDADVWSYRRDGRAGSGMGFIGRPS
ncbi:hypothetical protein [Phascolarctobacterium faecium]